MKRCMWVFLKRANMLDFTFITLKHRISPSLYGLLKRIFLPFSKFSQVSLRFFLLPTFSLISFALFSFPFLSHAENITGVSWSPRIYDTALPTHLVAIDKAQQQFYLFEKKSPLSMTLNYPCTTGKVEGDKQVENDLRTPEGVYFVEYKIDSGLDFMEYGGIAYTLNYPNPVDKLRGKTGYGIWIHSKGEAIKPRITRGCIALDLANIAEVGTKLTPGTPVLVAETITTDNIPLPDPGVSRHLRLRMEQWTRAWASRSDDFFSFYNEEAYTRAMPESFKAFRANKERLFKLLKWINIFNREVFVIEGPGYWVTWAEQFYRAPNLSTEGIRRLYWQRNEEGDFYIIGMEWIPRNVGMQMAYEKGQLVAKSDIIVSDVGGAHLAQNQYSAPTHLSDPVQRERPLMPSLTMPEASPTGMSPALTLAATSEETPTSTLPVNKNTVVETTPSPLDDTVRNTLQERTIAWAGMWQQRRLEDFLAFYHPKKFGKIKDIPHKDSLKALKARIAPTFRLPWTEIMQSPARLERRGDTVTTTFNQWVHSPGQMPTEGQRTLYWQKDNNVWYIVAEHWEERYVGMNVLYLEKVSDHIMDWVEKWRIAWLAANVDNYALHYAPQARQGKRAKIAMVRQKRDLWKSAAPANIELSGIRVQLHKEGVRVDMTQVYTDVNGKGDKGVKSLILQPHIDNAGQRTWRILREEWEKQ